MKSLNDNITNDNAPVNCELDKSRLTESSSEYVDKNDTKTNTQTSAITENYKHEEKKKSPIVWILAGVIGLLILGIGILGGMLLMKDKKSSGSDNNDITVNSTTTIEQKEGITTATVVTSATEIQTTIAEATTVVITSPAISDEQFNSAVDSFISSYSSDSNDPVMDTQYSLYDVNGDGIKELFIKAEHISGNYTHMYLYKNGSFSSTDVTGNRKFKSGINQ